MANSRTLMKSALVVIVLMAVIHSGSAAEKLASCCKKVNKLEITEPITGYLIQRPTHECVPAIILQTEKGLFCSPVKAEWVRRKVQAFLKAKAQATTSSVVPSSTVSLLSIITSTASPPSSSTPPSSVVPSSTVSLFSIITSTASPPSTSTPSSSSSLPSSSTPSSASTPSSSSSLPSSSSFPSSSSLPSSSFLPSFLSTSEMPAGETFSETDNE
ncbi:putative protein TPRXL [Morone saxatilis]|uniref:putative protein TPRXL n=1 Tax=Morone saxatilis TaxID=34816 RepID=UPI0015E1CF41|nr:putative protein TPRXL [Morone saxatilis]